MEHNNKKKNQKKSQLLKHIKTTTIFVVTYIHRKPFVASETYERHKYVSERFALPLITVKWRIFYASEKIDKYAYTHTYIQTYMDLYKCVYV